MRIFYYLQTMLEYFAKSKQTQFNIFYNTFQIYLCSGFKKYIFFNTNKCQVTSIIRKTNLIYINTKSITVFFHE